MNKAGFSIYADDNAPYVTGETIEDVINSVEHNSIKLSKWFSDNQIKANNDKCHLLISDNENITINVDDNVIDKSNCKKLLGVNVDYKLNFNKHLGSVLKKAGRKLNTLSRNFACTNSEKKTILRNLFFKSQFNFCPSV